MPETTMADVMAELAALEDPSHVPSTKGTAMTTG